MDIRSELVRWYSRLRMQTGRHAGSMTLVGGGGFCLAFAVVIRNDAVVAVPLVITGGALLALGASLPDVEELSTTKEGFTIKRRPPPTAHFAVDWSDPLEFDPGQHPALIAADTLEGVEPEPPEEVVRARMALAAQSLRALLNPQSGPLTGTTLHLYLYDTGDDRLRALGVAGPPSDEGWEPGMGATGVAYDRGEFVLATGDAVRDATYGLTPEQQQRAADLTAVAAMPVFTTRLATSSRFSPPPAATQAQCSTHRRRSMRFSPRRTWQREYSLTFSSGTTMRTMAADMARMTRKAAARVSSMKDAKASSFSTRKVSRSDSRRALTTVMQGSDGRVRITRGQLSALSQPRRTKS